MATINDVAKRAGVSKGTVSHVFNKTKFTSEEVTQRVLKAAQELNYKSNYYAKTLATNKSKVIGIQIDSPTGSMTLFQQKVTNGILKVCSEENYYLLLMPSMAEEREYFPIDGLILMNPTLNDDYQIDIPHVWLGKPSHNLIGQASYVDNDNQELLNELTQLLLPKTTEGLVFMNAPEDMTVAQDRKKGFYEAISSNAKPDIKVDHLHYQREESPAAFAYEELSRLWQENRFDTVIVDSDFMAQGVYKFASENALNIPQDISVIAISESLEASEFFTPALSFVDLKEAKLGEKMASHLIKFINNQETRSQEIVKSEIKIKDSIRV